MRIITQITMGVKAAGLLALAAAAAAGPAPPAPPAASAAVSLKYDAAAVFPSEARVEARAYRYKLYEVKYP